DLTCPPRPAPRSVEEGSARRHGSLRAHPWPQDLEEEECVRVDLLEATSVRLTSIDGVDALCVSDRIPRCEVLHEDQDHRPPCGLERLLVLDHEAVGRKNRALVVALRVAALRSEDPRQVDRVRVIDAPAG